MNDASQYSEQDRARIEEERASDQSDRNAAKQHASGASDNAGHYNKLTDHNDVSSESSRRDLGTVGGGPIPGGNAYSSMNASNGVGDGAPADRGSTDTPSMRESPGAPDAAGQPQQGNLGGRNPGQTQNQPIGDQDSTFGHRDPEDDHLSDPMTSRAPDKVKQASKQDS
ncbi:MAG: hypothetical protein PVS3B1_24590 [Ktedonobacteraceae bacterium]